MGKNRDRSHVRGYKGRVLQGQLFPEHKRIGGGLFLTNLFSRNTDLI